jgi:hypothetical protein
MKNKCLNCDKLRKKLLVHNTNDNFCTSDCKRRFYQKQINELDRLENELEKINDLIEAKKKFIMEIFP